MFPPNSSTLLALSATLLAVSPLGAQTLVYTAPVYSSTVSPRDSGIGQEVASGVHLATGSDRQIVTAEIPFFSVLPAAATLTFSLYGAVPTGDQPGQQLFTQLSPAATPLYTTGPLSIALTGSGRLQNQVQTLIFSNINTLVPENFYWSITMNSVTFDTSSTGGNLPPPNNGQGSRIGPVYGNFPPGATVPGTDTSLGFALARHDPQTSGSSGNPWSQIGLGFSGPSNGIPYTDPGRNRTLAATFTAVPEASVSCLTAGALVLLTARRRRR